MLLYIFVLGLLLGHAVTRPTPASKIAFGVVWIALATVPTLGLYGHYYGYTTWWPVKIEKFVEGAYGRAIIILLMGLLIWLYAGQALRTLKEFLFESQTSALTHPWIAGALAIIFPIVTLFLAAFLFMPDTLFRLESVKVGQVEAKFAAAAEKTLRAYNEVSADDSNSILTRWASMDTRIVSMIQPLQELVTAPERKEKARSKHGKALDFLMKVAKPLAIAMQCFTNEFRVKDTNVQHMAVILANDWANLIRTLSRTPKANEQKIVNASYSNEVSDHFEEQKLGWKFITYVFESDRIVEAIDRLLRERDSNCGGEAKRAWTGVQIDNEYTPRMMALFTREELDEIFSNGFVLVFLSDLFALTHGYERAVAFMSDITSTGFLDTADDAKSGEAYFYFRRGSFKQEVHWVPRDAVQDFDYAEGIILDLLSSVKLSSEKSVTRWSDIEKYHESFRAAILNNKVYFLVREWLEGKPLDPFEVAKLSAAASELEKWISDQSIVDSLDVRRGRTVSVALIPSAYDTLAMYEIVLGEIKRDRNLYRCGRIFSYLSRSQSLWEDQLKSRLGAAPYRAASRILEAHFSIYRSICG